MDNRNLFTHKKLPDSIENLLNRELPTCLSQPAHHYNRECPVQRSVQPSFHEFHEIRTRFARDSHEIQKTTRSRFSRNLQLQSDENITCTISQHTKQHHLLSGRFKAADRTVELIFAGHRLVLNLEYDITALQTLALRPAPLIHLADDDSLNTRVEIQLTSDRIIQIHHSEAQLLAKLITAIFRNCLRQLLFNRLLLKHQCYRLTLIISEHFKLYFSPGIRRSDRKTELIPVTDRSTIQAE